MAKSPITAANKEAQLQGMAYRNLDARRRGGGETGSNFVWPWSYQQATKSASPRHQPLHAPHIESWEDRLSQPRMTAHGAWPYTALSPAVRPSSVNSTPPHNRQTAPTTWRQNRAAATERVPQHVSGSSSHANTIPVDITLKLLYDALVSCRSMCEGYEQAFRQHAGQLDWAPEDTRDKVWRDMITRYDDPDKFRKVTDKLRDRLSSLKDALAIGRTSKVQHSSVVKQDPGVLERRLRAARKAVRHCEGLLDLVHRARVETKACRFLVEEASEVIAMLDPKTHSMLYDDSEEEKVDSTRGKKPGHVPKDMKRSPQRSSKETGAVKGEGDHQANTVGQSTEGLQQETGGNEWQGDQGEERQEEDGEGWG